MSVWYDEQLVDRKYETKAQSKRSRDIGFRLSLDDWRELFRRNGGVCDYTGLPMVLSNDERKEDSVTIERIDNALPYQKGNVCLVRHDANEEKARLFESHDTSTPQRKHLMEVRNKLCATLFNPEALRGIRERYCGATILAAGEKAAIVPEHKSFNQEGLPFFVFSEEMRSENNELFLARAYMEFGVFVENHGGTYALSFSNFKARMGSKKCGLTGREFRNGQKKILWVRDKTQPITMDNTVITTIPVCDALDKFLLESKLTLPEAKTLVKALEN